MIVFFLFVLLLLAILNDSGFFFGGWSRDDRRSTLRPSRRDTITCKQVAMCVCVCVLSAMLTAYDDVW